MQEEEAVRALYKLKTEPNVSRTPPPKIRAAPEGKFWSDVEYNQGWKTVAPKLKTPRGGRRTRKQTQVRKRKTRDHRRK